MWQESDNISAQEQPCEMPRPNGLGNKIELLGKRIAQLEEMLQLPQVAMKDHGVVDAKCLLHRQVLTAQATVQYDIDRLESVYAAIAAVIASMGDVTTQ